MVVPIIFIYDILTKKRFDSRLLYLTIPLIAVLLYEAYNMYIYGNSHLNLAASFSIGQKSFASKLFPVVAAFVYFGGGCISCLPVIPFTLKLRNIIYSALIIGFLSIAFLFLLQDPQQQRTFFSRYMWLRQFQITLMIAAGLSISFIAVNGFMKSRDAKSAMLLAWITCPFLFAGLVNWTVNCRTLLPAIPAFSILFAGYLFNRKWPVKNPGLRVFTALLLSAAISIVLMITDYKSANSARDSARLISQNYGSYSGQITFQGHWGFQYYMQDKGYLPVDFNHFMFNKGDIMIIPSNQCLIPINPVFFQEMKILDTDTLRFVGLQNGFAPAGFYSSTYGPAPFLFVPIKQETYILCGAKKDFYIDLNDLIHNRRNVKVRY